MHNVMRTNYTTYDIRWADDVLNPNTSHCDIMLLSAEDDKRANHQYTYTCILSIYHMNVMYTGSSTLNYQAQ